MKRGEPTLTERAIDRKVNFATYLNLARNNAYVIFQNIAKKIGENPAEIREDRLFSASIIQLLKTANRRPALQKSIVKLLEKHFPFVRHLTTKIQTSEAIKKQKENPENMLGLVLEMIFTRLNNERNVHSHYHHDPLDYALTTDETDDPKITADDATATTTDEAPVQTTKQIADTIFHNLFLYLFQQSTRNLTEKEDDIRRLRLPAFW